MGSMKELLLIGFVLTSTVEGHTADEKVALRTAARAFYKQSEAEKHFNEMVKKEVPKPVQTVAGNIFIIAKTIQDRRLTLTWSF